MRVRGVSVKFGGGGGDFGVAADGSRGGPLDGRRLGGLLTGGLPLAVWS